MTAIFAHGKDRQVSKGEQTLSATRLTAPADKQPLKPTLLIQLFPRRISPLPHPAQ